MIRYQLHTILTSIVLGAVFIFLFSDFTGTNSKAPSSEISIDADLSDWDSSPFLESLTAPWKPNLQDQTVFDYTTSDGYFYFYFKTIDTTLTLVPFTDESSIAEGDRVELFFSKDVGLTDYYCLEINPRGDILDYQASYYRKFDDTWDLKNLKTATDITKNGFIVEGKISLKELNELSLHDEIYLGIFRADFVGKEKVIWFSWAVPDSDKPDFHIPSALRKFDLSHP